MSLKLHRVMHISDAEPSSCEFLVAVASEVGMILHRYIEVHDEIFGFSLRKLLPILGIFQPIDFTLQFRSLRFIETDLELVAEQLPDSCPEAVELRAVLEDYTQRLLSTVLKLQEICGHLFRKADGTEVYSRQDYKHDLEIYNRSMTLYRSSGSHLNRLLNNLG
jgi:hypothetical protein